MTTQECVDLLNTLDPSGRRTIRIESTGFRGGVGSAWAKYPTIESIQQGMDHDCGHILIRPSVSLKKR